ncbi:MAG: MFS transporter [Woeseiaceae bacterium]|nr:MFS transporter [Woeseiaceae bacterium]
MLTNRKRSLFAVIVSMVIVNLVYGLTLPLLSIVLDSQGISKTVIGLSIVAQASAGVVLAPLIPQLIIRAGAARVMQGAALLAAGTLLALGIFQEVSLWFPLRFLLGASAAMLWSASESVINELAAENWRGRLIGIYGSAGAAGFALGPLVLLITGTSGLLPFAVTAVFVVAASLPLFWLGRETKIDGADRRVSLRRIFRFVPHIMLLNFAYAAAVESFIAFFPLFGLHIGLGEARSLSLLTTFALGGVFLLLPLGWLADHMPRPRLLLACIVFTIIGFFILPELISHRVAGPAFVFTLGGVEGMIYTLGMVLLGQRFRGPELAAATVLYTGMWGAGTMLGPLIVGASMDVLGDQSMPYLIALIYVIYLPVFFLAKRR